MDQTRLRCPRCKSGDLLDDNGFGCICCGCGLVFDECEAHVEDAETSEPTETVCLCPYCGGGDLVFIPVPDSTGFAVKCLECQKIFCESELVEKEI